ncbi:MAG: S8 family serine peptidase [Clostridiales bacterium]|jgi:subtilisin family serine protease|nr:S8 family serine peptidase [Clostridiales bacterium]
MSVSYEDEALLEDSELGAGFNIEDNTWEVIVKYNGDLRDIAAELGADVEILSENYAIITLSANRVTDLNNFSQIEHIEKPKNLKFSTLSDAISRSCVSTVQSSLGFNLTGRGVLVAIADSGVDYTHPDFRNEDGGSRIMFFWDQAAFGQSSPPEGFKYGVEYTNEQLNNALKNRQPFSVIPELDFLGHGTAVAGVAAGNGRGAVANIGVAPESSLIVARLGRNGERSFVRNTELMRALKYFVDKAKSLNMPLVINMSFGTNNGSHDGQSLFETFIDETASQWKTNIIAATGNEGGASHHYFGTILENGITNVVFHTSAGLQSFYITFWQNFVDEFYLSLVLPSGASTGEISYVSPIRSMRFGNIAVYAEYSQPSHYNENQEIFFQIKAINGVLPSGQWIINVRAGKIVEGKFDIWLPVTEEITTGTGFNAPDPLSTITLPATSFRVISVGGYDYRINAIAAFSGKGYTRTGMIKPDLVAPAVNITAAKRNGGYDTYSGTSIAAPFVTGSVALMMQWGIVDGNDPFLYGQRVKAFLKMGAARAIGREFPNESWGYGALCLSNTMNEMVRYQTL